MSEIFFSYSSKDRERVRPFHEALSVLGFDVFWDMETPVGEKWEPWIKRKLMTSRCVIVFWTPNSSTSDNVAYEVRVAKEEVKPLLEILLEPMRTLDMSIHSSSVQALKLQGWRGDQRDLEWAKLVAFAEHSAAPPWMGRKLKELDRHITRGRRSLQEADEKVRNLEDAHEKEVRAQGDLRRERDRLSAEKNSLNDALAEAKATQSKLITERDTLKVERDKQAKDAATYLSAFGSVRKELDALKGGAAPSAPAVLKVEAESSTHSLDTKKQTAATSEAKKEAGTATLTVPPAALKSKTDWEGVAGAVGCLLAAILYLPSALLKSFSIVLHGSFTNSATWPWVMSFAFYGLAATCVWAVLASAKKEPGNIFGNTMLFALLLIAIPYVSIYFVNNWMPFTGWAQVLHLLPIGLGAAQFVLGIGILSDEFS